MSITTLNINAQQPILEKVYSENTYQFTGVAVSAEGRVFVTYPRWSETYKFAVVELMKDGSIKPFPDENMNTWIKGKDGKEKWVCVQTAFIDDDDYLYIVDPAAPMLESVVEDAAKVVKFNLKTDEIVRTYYFPGTIDNNSYINDIRVDTKRQVAYLTNSGTGGIVILDLASGKSRQVLQNNKSVHPDPAVKFIIDGRELKRQGQPIPIQSDGIALDPSCQYIYYKTIPDKKLYRIKTSALLDTTLTGLQLASNVEDLGEKVHSDGMIFDKQGNLYMGDVVNYSMVQLTPDMKMHIWIKSPQLIWPDTYSISGGYIYITASQFHLQPPFNDGINKRTTPYMLFRAKLPDSIQ